MENNKKDHLDIHEEHIFQLADAAIDKHQSAHGGQVPKTLKMNKANADTLISVLPKLYGRAKAGKSIRGSVIVIDDALDMNDVIAE